MIFVVIYYIEGKNRIFLLTTMLVYNERMVIMYQEYLKICDNNF